MTESTLKIFFKIFCLQLIEIYDKRLSVGFLTIPKQKEYVSACP
jgi:hypothetical protein